MVLVLLLPALDAQRWDVMHTRPEDLRQIARLVENKSVLTDIPYLAARTSSLELLDPASLTNMERTGAWSAAGITRELEEKKYELGSLEPGTEYFFCCPHSDLSPVSSSGFQGPDGNSG